MHRTKRLQHFRISDRDTKEKKKKNEIDEKSTVLPVGRPPKQTKTSLPTKRTWLSQCETSSNRSKSSDDFSGFDDDSSADKPPAKRPRISNVVKQGDFDVYLQKYLDSTMDDLSLTKDKAKLLLKKKWKKLTPVQKARYKSKISYDPSTSSCDTDDSSSDQSSLTSSKSKRSSVQDDEGGEVASRGVYRVPKNEKVCHSCENATQKSGADMVKCKGLCCSVFHLSCVGLDVPPEGDFKCADCLAGIHKCFICKSEEGKKDRCSVFSCGKFYHPECVKLWPQVTKARQIEVSPKSNIILLYTVNDLKLTVHDLKKY